MSKVEKIKAEIERRIKSLNKDRDFNYLQIKELEALLSSLDTFEVKEVDLEKEFFDWYHKESANDYNASILYERYSTTSKKLAKHFFELGLKAQKGK